MNRRSWLGRALASGRFPLWYWVITGVVLGGWTFITRVFVPWSIRRAHAGAPLISRLLSGRHRIPVEEYLADWDSVRPEIAFPALTLVLLLFLLAVAIRQPLVERVGGDRVAPRWSARMILAVGAGLGLLTGLGEAYYLVWTSFVQGRTIEGFRHISTDSLWMAPVADMVAFVLVGVLVVGVGSWKPTARSGAVVLSIFGFLTLHTWAMVTGRVWWWASALLAAGIAIRLARFAGRRAEAYTHLARRGAAWLAGMTIGVAASVILSPIASERRALAALPPSRPGAPDVLLLVLDTQRAASTSLYAEDYPDQRITTPNLERWAETAVVFDRAIAPASWTLPSHASMFTGRLNQELGTGFFTPLDERYPTLAEVLQANGYVTAGFVANIDFVSDFYGLDRGFIHYQDQPRSIGMTLESSWLTRVCVRTARRWIGNRDDVVRKRAADVNHEFLSWLATKPGRPFFAFLNYFDPHSPYRPPVPFDTLFREERGRYHIGRDYSALRFTTQDIEELEAAYDASIAYTDLEVGRLLDTLENAGVLENALVLITADHGESFGEHGWLGHANSLHLSEVHVPLLIRPPGGVHPGRRAIQVVSLRDLSATVLDLVGIDRVLPGRSLAGGMVTSRSPVDGHEREKLAPTPAISELRADWLSLVSGGYHYLRRRDGSEELYDIEADRPEAVNLVDDPDRFTVLKDLRSELARLTGDARPLGSSRSPED